MNKNLISALVIVILIVAGGIFVWSQSGTRVSSTTSQASSDIQIVKLSVGSNGGYVLSPSTLTKGKTVRLEADMANMPGCSKSIVISVFNVRKTFTAGDNSVEFTPDKTGTFNIACSMNMYRGQFSVVDVGGAKSTYVEAPSSGGATCGGSGGGCGCGG